MKRIEHNESDSIFPYIEYIPENTDKPLPLIIQLHGAGERGCGGEELALVETHAFAKLIADRDDIQCRFIMPQCPHDQYWSYRAESLIAFIDSIIAKGNTDTSRIYLTGYSMGGFGTWSVATSCPDKFAAIAPVCGGGMSWTVFTFNMPIWVFHGNIDDVVPVEYSKMMVEGLKACDKNVRFTCFDGVAHNAWDYAYNDELLKWLLEQSK